MSIKIGEISATNVDTFYRGPSTPTISIEKLNINNARIVFDIKDDKINYFEFSQNEQLFKIPIPKDWSIKEIIELCEIFSESQREKSDPRNNLGKSPLWERWLSVGANAGTIIEFLAKITGAV